MTRNKQSSDALQTPQIGGADGLQTPLHTGFIPPSDRLQTAYSITPPPTGEGPLRAPHPWGSGNWGPFVRGISSAERLARLRSLRAVAKLLLGPPLAGLRLFRLIEREPRLEVDQVGSMRVAA